MPSTRLIVRGAPLPVSFKGDLNKLWFAMLDRLEVISPFGEVQLQIGGLMPTSNKGPWLKDGTQFWVWDEATKTYIPLDISASNAAMQAALAAALAGFAAARTEVTAEIAAAIAAAVAAIPPPVVSQGAHFVVNQISDISSGSVTNGSVNVDIPFNNIETDTEEGFSAGAYTIKKNGFYSIYLTVNTSITSGSGTSYTIQCRMYKNGSEIDRSNSGVSIGGEAIFQISHQEVFSVGDKITAGVSFLVAGGPVTFEVKSGNTRMSGFLTS